MEVDIPGYGPFDFGDMPAAEIEKTLTAVLKGAPSKEAIANRLEGIMRVRSMPAPPAPAASPPPTRRETAATPYESWRGLDMNRPEPQSRPAEDRAKDVITTMAGGATFGLAPKLSAAVNAYIVKNLPPAMRALINDGPPRDIGSYSEELARNRAEDAAARERIGPAAAIAADVTGGGMTGSVLARAPALWQGGLAGGTGAISPGVTLVGRLGPRAGVLRTGGAGMLEGAAYGAAAGAGNTDSGKIDDYVDHALKGGLLGGLTGGVLPLVTRGIQKIITPFPTSDPVRAGMVRTLEDADVPVSAGRATGNKTLELFEDAVAKLPFGRRPQGDVDPMERVTAEAMRHAGLTGNRATPEVLNGGFQRIGSDINNIQSRYHTNVDNQFLNLAARVESDILPLVQQNNQGIVRHLIDRLTSQQNIPPQEAQALRTQLTQIMRDFQGANSDNQARQAVIALREGLDDALTRTVNATEAANRAAGRPYRVGDSDELDRLRRQYANLHVLTDAIIKSGKSGDAGILTPAALENAVSRSVGAVQAARGQGDLNELGKASNYLLSGLPDSFTATREGILNPFKVAASPVLNAAVTGPRAQQYWGNQAMPNRAAGSAYPAPIAGAVAGEQGAQVPSLLDDFWSRNGLPGPRP